MPSISNTAWLIVAVLAAIALIVWLVQNVSVN
jgi:hypothetical protein